MKSHPGKQFQQAYGVYLMWMDKERKCWMFCPYCFEKIEWGVENDPPKYCADCGKIMVTRLAVPKKGK